MKMLEEAREVSELLSGLNWPGIGLYGWFLWDTAINSQLPQTAGGLLTK